jgi:hypothetical protein
MYDSPPLPSLPFSNQNCVRRLPGAQKKCAPSNTQDCPFQQAAFAPLAIGRYFCIREKFSPLIQGAL